MRVVGYIRVSTSEQAESGAGLDAQREAIVAEIHRRGWELVEVFEDANGASGKSMRNREGLAAALDVVESDRADGLIVAKLDRLSRSLLDFAALMAESQENGWSLIALDLGVDTSSPAGEMMAHVLATFAQFERRMIGQRTKDALHARTSSGKPWVSKSGRLCVGLGRPPGLTLEVRRRIVRERQEGRTLAAIAADLNAERVPTAQGGARWWPSTVKEIGRAHV